jgi:site-specific DNA-methyltransferase (adenine-specific)
VFNRDAVREPYTDTFLKNAAGKVRKATKGRFSNGTKETIYTAHKDGALPRDVIKVAALAGGAGKKERVNHPTQKPLALCDTLIKAALNEDSSTLIVVPFAGSGSECVSAQKNNADFIGFEINSEYIAIANKRLLLPIISGSYFSVADYLDGEMEKDQRGVGGGGLEDLEGEEEEEEEE